MLWTFAKYIFYKAKQLTKRHKKFFGPIVIKYHKLIIKSLSKL